MLSRRAPGHPPSVAHAAAPRVTVGQEASSSCTYSDGGDGRWRTGPCGPLPSKGAPGTAAWLTGGGATLAACRRIGWVPTSEESLRDGHGTSEDLNAWLRPEDEGGLAADQRTSAAATSSGGLWALIPASPGGQAETARQPPACPEGHTHDIPHSAFENLLLRRALRRAGSDSRAWLPLWPPSYLPLWL